MTFLVIIIIFRAIARKGLTLFESVKLLPCVVLLFHFVALLNLTFFILSSYFFLLQLDPFVSFYLSLHSPLSHPPPPLSLFFEDKSHPRHMTLTLNAQKNRLICVKI